MGTGTFGTLWGLPLAWALAQLPHVGWQVAILLALCGIGVPICGRAAQQLGTKDPGCVVWDELTALPIVFLGVPASGMQRPEILVVGFLLFRVFDISKLPPGKQLEHLPRGWGIMADDVAAAVYGLLSLTAFRWFIPWLGQAG